MIMTGSIFLGPEILNIIKYFLSFHFFIIQTKRTPKEYTQFANDSFFIKKCLTYNIIHQISTWWIIKRLTISTFRCFQWNVRGSNFSSSIIKGCSQYEYDYTGSQHVLSFFLTSAGFGICFHLKWRYSISFLKVYFLDNMTILESRDFFKLIVVNLNY